MYIPMAEEGRVLSEAFLTLEVLMWLFPSVGFLEGTEVGAVLEAFPTLGTLVQALHNGDLPMSAKWKVVDSLPTDSALIRLLPSVGPLVNCEARALVKAFPTLPTLVCSLPCVSPQVGSGVGVFTEAFPIFTVLVMLLSCVNSDAEQGKNSAKAFPTFMTFISSFQFSGWLMMREERTMRVFSSTQEMYPGLLTPKSLVTHSLLGWSCLITLPGQCLCCFLIIGSAPSLF
uniref:Uncharacterized protein n=1 Tax=Pipistrellus kuhlii TaxID=59472 RepID=A0A7J7YUM9_PIPKU|nr:hypothetical protein mPipKuh1_000135 [Pipistrellus kuhlii]